MNETARVIAAHGVNKLLIEETAECLFGAMLIGLIVGGTIVGIGFVFFAASATAWVVAGWRMGEPSLVAMHGVFLAINLLGIWRWLVA